ncbi:M20 family metallopeptidase [Phreatobacter stygius]|uniref:Probable succinyl-diaminopimelate desuccinylase n=1 Tax=Phreatobacter stygius TaxID=1940610 RepID=A0A4D7B018_9HYPH|nr:M20 family metallopeptidase [Phreatobacter stygius]QCI66959.1 M20 family metallopeptidase [Phreatobacter stygius]
MHSPSVALAQRLIQFRSLNPPGEEAACIAHLGALLSPAGLSVETYEFAPGRPSLVARLAGSGHEAPLCFTGHVDVVPLGMEPWSRDPFAGDIVDGKLYGRGSSDMKAGVAAFVTATLDLAAGGTQPRRGITLVITAGEETGCEGAFHLGRTGALGRAALLIVAEPTSNRPIIAHKGSVRVAVRARGRTVHSSMPELGDNAIDKIADWIQRLKAHRFAVPAHPLLGPTTASVTTVSGGLNINSVPDLASFTVDFRTIPAHRHGDLLAEIAELFGAEAEIEVITDFAGYSTDPADDALAPLFAILTERFGERPEPKGAPYFTDASALVPAFANVPTVVIGPGEAAQCHQTDEFCFVDRIDEAHAIYGDLITRFCVQG